MLEEKITVDRLAGFSDAFFAVIVTIMVLELKAPEQAAFSDLGPLWPTAISYAVSYLFIAIIWINHHHLMRLVDGSSDAPIDMDELRSSVPGVALTVCDELDRGHPPRTVARRVLRRTVCVR